LKICLWGMREKDYGRNTIVVEALKAAGHTVDDIHHDIWHSRVHKYNAVNGVRAKTKLLARITLGYVNLWWKYLNAKDHDIIFIGYIGHLDAVLIWPLAMVKRKKIVFDCFISLYDTMVRDRGMFAPGGLGALLMKKLDSLSCLAADAVLMDTQTHIDMLSSLGYKINNKAIRLFVSADESLFHPLPEGTGKALYSSEKFNVFFMGKFTPLHGLKYVVQAAEILKEDKRIHFTLLGAGQLFDEIKSMSAELDNLAFVPFMPLEELPKYYAGADLCLGIFGDTPKTSNVIPTKVIYGLAMRKPVLTMKSPAAGELLQDGINAYLCPGGDAEALAHKIKHIANLSSQERDAVGKNAFTTYQDHCSFEVQKRQLDSIVRGEEPIVAL
jgi:glycosyltransferase involved in cell wall biosynthesis